MTIEHSKNIFIR